ncbi:MAG: Ldh family oxidoreductase [Methylobacterium sp.]|nr:Ldh family oxidoreductase [Methylobacterium sp.]MCA3619441.1 Ldh family oxidoreductase [Methylobacterium sp.]MCA3622398.1 Ldh family oxidoreductase [Methylobacterium sp.]
MSNPARGDQVRLTLAEVETLTLNALLGAGLGAAQALSVTRSVVAAEADGIHSHGLARLPTYCEHGRVGKIDGKAVAVLEDAAPGIVRVDARDGFAHPAIDLGLPELVAKARKQGIAALAVTNSYNCGVVGYHVERIAMTGLLALGFVNAPASIAPVGGRLPVFGTNPIALAVPRAAAPPLVLDQSSSVVAKSEILVHKARGEALPPGWALDRDGNPTTDPAAALDGGTMVPSGGYKGFGLALIVELLAAWATGASLSMDASSFADNTGGPPRTGQFFIGIDVGATTKNSDAPARLARLLDGIAGQPGVRLPGDRRLAARARAATEGIAIPAALYERIRAYAD